MKKKNVSIKIMINIENPNIAFEFKSILNNNGIGLFKLKFIINNNIKIHPIAILKYPNINTRLKKIIDILSSKYISPKIFYLEKLIEGISIIAIVFWPKPVNICFSDFKSKKYKKLIGGDKYFLKKKYLRYNLKKNTKFFSKEFLELFEIECNAIKNVRNNMGLTNIQIAIPFIKTLNQVKIINEILEKNNLKRFRNKLKIILIIKTSIKLKLINLFFKKFDIFFIKLNYFKKYKNICTNIPLNIINKQNSLLKKKISKIINICKKNKKIIGIYYNKYENINFIKWLIEQKVNFISLNTNLITKINIFK